MTTSHIECRFQIEGWLDSRERRMRLPFGLSEHLKANGIPAQPAVLIATGDTNLNATDVIPTVTSGTLSWVYYNRSGYIDFTWTP